MRTDHKTIEYYNKNILNYIERTFSIDMEQVRRNFLQYLPKKSKILDAGCGPGRDLLAFKEKRYEVLGFDAAENMVKYVQEKLKIPVIQGFFEEMEFLEEFDGIWASASLVHVPIQSMSIVIERFRKALKPEGILAFSFKEGTGISQDGDRTFTYMDKDALFLHLKGFVILNQWVHLPQKLDTTTTCRWLNTIVRKKMNL